ncbi:sel1 repeat family protein, partial [Salmonella enterica subsp. enterica serovar Kentucky]|nr:sel1 repeat family protein [Salmonella enterica subsp. enterica serovar Kentucky]
LYDSGFVEVDDKEARSLQWFRKAAELGQADAQNILGYFYLNGKRGIKRDLQKGVQWYELAAAQGNADALINLGNSHRQIENLTAFAAVESSTSKSGDPFRVPI